MLHFILWVSNFLSDVAIVVSIKQHAKKVVSDSPRLVDFAVGLLNSVLNLPEWATASEVFRGIQIIEEL